MNYPQIIWISPPTNINFHDNDRRKRFADVLDVAVQKYPEIACLTLKKAWMSDNPNLYLKHQGRYTPEGEITYWLGVDAALKFWDRTLTDIMIKRQRKEMYKSFPSRNQTTTTRNHNSHQESARYRLPPPPLRHHRHHNF